jgi:hypothetical protein
MNRLATWIFSLFDTRSDYEKNKERGLVESIKKLNLTHHIHVSKRGAIHVEKRK